MLIDPGFLIDNGCAPRMIPRELQMFESSLILHGPTKTVSHLHKAFSQTIFTQPSHDEKSSRDCVSLTGNQLSTRLIYSVCCLSLPPRTQAQLHPTSSTAYAPWTQQ